MRLRGSSSPHRSRPRVPGGRAVVVVGALLAATLTGENNDTYLQVGLITTIGVSAKRGLLSGPPAICRILSRHVLCRNKFPA